MVDSGKAVYAQESFPSQLQGEDEQTGYSCVIYEVREGPFTSTPFNILRKPADYF